MIAGSHVFQLLSSLCHIQVPQDQIGRSALYRAISAVVIALFDAVIGNVLIDVQIQQDLFNGLAGFLIQGINNQVSFLFAAQIYVQRQKESPLTAIFSLHAHCMDKSKPLRYWNLPGHLNTIVSTELRAEHLFPHNVLQDTRQDCAIALKVLSCTAFEHGVKVPVDYLTSLMHKIEGHRNEGRFMDAILACIVSCVHYLKDSKEIMIR